MSLETDFIVIGSGVAGLRASIALAESGANVTVLTKDKASESNTEYAQGGVAVVLSEDERLNCTRTTRSSPVPGCATEAVRNARHRRHKIH